MRKIVQATYNTVAGGKAVSKPGSKKGGKVPRYETIIDVIYDELGPSATLNDSGPDDVLTVGYTTLTYYTAPKTRDAVCDVEGKDKKLVKQIEDLLADISDLSDINGPDRRTAETIADLLKDSITKKEKYDKGWYSITSGGKAKSVQAVVYFDGGSCIVYAGDKISTRWYDLNSIAKTLGGDITKLKTKDDALEYLRDVAFSRVNTDVL